MAITEGCPHIRGGFYEAVPLENNILDANFKKHALMVKVHLYWQCLSTSTCR